MAHEKRPQSIGPFSVREHTPMSTQELAKEVNRQLTLITQAIDNRYGYRGRVPVHNAMDLQGNQIVNVAEGSLATHGATVSQIQKLEATIADAQRLLRSLQQQVAGQTQLSNAAPAQIDAGDTAQAGSDQLASRSNHQHPVNTAAIGDIQAIGPAAAGTSLALARGDHVHDVAELPTASLPAAGAGENGRLVIENDGLTLNLVAYANGQRARLTGVLF
jgi:hypothetical protein